MAKLQVALDFVDMSRALKCAEAAVEGGADILEVGTPLVKSEGLNAVRELRARFPRMEIVADMKTMDAGRAEMEIASKAGATIATVLGVSSESTVKECIEAGRNYGIKVAVDLLGVAEPVEFARSVEAWGAFEVGVHTGVDQQMRGKQPFELLRRVREAVSIVVSAAGGINSETVAAAVEAGADIVIVGGAITKARDVKAATMAMKEALVSCKPVKSELFRRVGEADVLEVFSKVSSANVSDAMHRAGEITGLTRFSGSGRLAGRVITVRTYPGDWAKPVEAIDGAEPGDVIVIDAGGQETAVWGELATESAIQKKVAGVVINGGARDIEDIRATGFTLWALCLNPTAGEPKGFGEIGVPITIRGTEVASGDWIVGDDTGLVRVPKARLAEMANRAMDVLERENRIREEIREGSTLSAVAELLRWEKKG